MSNVKAAVKQLGVDYPVAVDDNYDTWNADANEYWPAEYLIDASGNVRHVDFGEGDYADTEQLIRDLLTAAHQESVAPTDRRGQQDPGEAMSPETYIGDDRVQYLDSPTPVVENAPGAVTPSLSPCHPAPSPCPGTWDEQSEEATAGAEAELAINSLPRTYTW